VVLDHCARLGYLGAELAVGEKYGIAIDNIDAAERARIADTFRRHGLECSVVAYFWGVATTPEAEVALRAAIDLAADLDPVGPGGTPPPVTTTVVGPPEAWEKVKAPVVESIGELCHHALARGVPFSIKAHADSVLDLPHKLIWPH
jgi:sugar phosphate isomerase/epimerase